MKTKAKNLNEVFIRRHIRTKYCTLDYIVDLFLRKKAYNDEHN